MRPAILTVLLALAIAASAGAAPSPNAERYAAVRQRYPLVTDATPDAVATRPGEFAGKLVEIRGTVTGTSLRNDGTGSFLLMNQTHQWAAEVTDPELMGQVAVSATLRVLCTVGRVDGTDQGTLLVVAIATESEMQVWEAAREAERQREEAARRAAQQRAERERLERERAAAARRSRQQPLASRGFARAQRAADLEEAVRLYAEAVRYFNRRLSPREAERIARNIIEYSLKYDLDARLVMAVIACESNFDAQAVSRAGAMGLGQLMPGTARGLGVEDPFDIEQNLEGATRLLRGHLATFARRRGASIREVTERDIALALACYNAGSGAVRRHKGIPPYRETRTYIKRVTALYRRLCGAE